MKNIWSIVKLSSTSRWQSGPVTSSPSLLFKSSGCQTQLHTPVFNSPICSDSLGSICLVCVLVFNLAATHCSQQLFPVQVCNTIHSLKCNISIFVYLFSMSHPWIISSYKVSNISKVVRHQNLLFSVLDRRLKLYSPAGLQVVLADRAIKGGLWQKLNVHVENMWLYSNILNSRVKRSPQLHISTTLHLYNSSVSHRKLHLLINNLIKKMYLASMVNRLWINLNAWSTVQKCLIQ